MRTARSLAGKPIGLVPDFISDGERKQLLHHARMPQARWNTRLSPDDVWYARMIDPIDMPDKLLKLMAKIRRRAARHIAADYGITQALYADTLQLVRWRPGDSQAPHADCEEPDGRPNQFPWRAFASIIYLNDEFEGGRIHFPGLGLEPEISPGTLAYFPSTADYLHGVTEVTSGLRYTMSCFYTFDPAHHDGIRL
ncbi:2OG-Fe(II) oxygenase [Qipengyuania sediminis]|uniref:2OG-Fe(II) oxygenase n=1 Tax=Qipengyuania sediminis TaxID=1532023 RepID=UPI0014043B9E|nr:2OG-Fe(II) oxygenase [Qipengyuania sediminis]